MFWNIKPISKSQTETPTPIEESINDNTDNPETETSSFEEDVMKDLEVFFNNNNWYENVEWEYWFTNAGF